MARFRPRAVPTIGVALGAVVFGSLGTWQVRRMGEADEERARWAARIAEPPFDAADAPDDPDLRRARVTGVPDWDRHLLVPGKYLWDQPGFDLVVPVRVDDGAVLVDLGWVPMDGVADIVARERAVAGPRTFEGLARVYGEEPAAGEGYPTEADGYRRYWRKLSPRAMGQGTAVAAFVVREGEALPAHGRPTDREPPVGGWTAAPHERPHGEYALTWFAILATLIGLWIHGSLQPAPGSVEPRR